MRRPSNEVIPVVALRVPMCSSTLSGSGVNHPGVSGDFEPWEGWSHAREHQQEVPV